ncbi:FtsK/SpoIIIE domain-containing protein [Streptomycetaceae bacterium NBC_01309]
MSANYGMADYYMWGLLRRRWVQWSLLAVLVLLAPPLFGVPSWLTGLAVLLVVVALVGSLIRRVRGTLRRRDELVRHHGIIGAEVVRQVEEKWEDLLPRLGLARSEEPPRPTGADIWRASLSKEEHTKFMVRMAEAVPIVTMPRLLAVAPTPSGPRFEFAPEAGVPVARCLAPEILEELAHHWGVDRVIGSQVARGRLGWTACINDPLTAFGIGNWRTSGDLYRWAALRDEDGATVFLPIAHTLVIGGTGSGKGSVLWSLVGHFRPWVASGEIRLFGVDPKRQELRTAPELFEQVAYTPEDWAALIDGLAVELERRQKVGGRSFAASADMPLTMLVVDEYAALGALDPDKRRRDRTRQQLLRLLSQGRSSGMYVCALVQSALKEFASDRDFFPLRVGLRTSSASETDMALGDGATERGAACHLIPPATEANGYASAGIAYVLGEHDPNPVRGRFPYTPDAVLADWRGEAEWGRGHGSEAA